MSKLIIEAKRTYVSSSDSNIFPFPSGRFTPLKASGAILFANMYERRSSAFAVGSEGSSISWIAPVSSKSSIYRDLITPAGLVRFDDTCRFLRNSARSRRLKEGYWPNEMVRRFGKAFG